MCIPLLQANCGNCLPRPLRQKVWRKSFRKRKAYPQGRSIKLFSGFAKRNCIDSSHVHWDHCHFFSSYLPKASVVFGPGSVEYTQPGYPTIQDSFYYSSFADKNDPWHKNVFELPPSSNSKWQPFGPFTHAYDLWDDGSFFLINAPGHVPGNLAAAGRLQSGEWIIMGGDCAHSM